MIFYITSKTRELNMGWWEKIFGKGKTEQRGSALIDPAVDNLMSGNAALGDLAKVQALLAAGANVNATNSGGMTAIQLAVMRGDRDTVSALLDMGGKVDFNSAAPAPEAAAAVEPVGGDIEIRKPLTFKKKL